MKPTTLAFTALMITPGAAVADLDRVSILAGSHHVDAKLRFEESNPGVFLTFEGETLDWSIGAYRNSFGKASVAVTAALPVLEWDQGELSVFVGLAHYPGDGRYFAVHLGDVVPIGGLQVRHNQMFLQVIPSDGYTTDAIVSFGLTFDVND